MQADFKTNKQKLIKVLGEVIRDTRKETGKTMYLISAESSMSKSTWREAELGLCNDINLSTIWKISEGLDIEPYKLLKEVSDRLGENFSLIENDE